VTDAPNIEEPNVDEEAFAAAQRVIRLTALRGEPVDDASCADCWYYLSPGDPLAFCWHEKLQMLVGHDWWCQHWEQAG
jgi:hypothetical protein